MSVLKTLIINPRSGVKPTATLFFMHGLGDSSAGWSDVAQMLSQRPSLSHVRFVLPNAPIQPVTLNMGMPMPSWFDSRSSYSCVWPSDAPTFPCTALLEYLLTFAFVCFPDSSGAR